jgi:hypothetical protein
VEQPPDSSGRWKRFVSLVVAIGAIAGAVTAISGLLVAGTVLGSSPGNVVPVARDEDGSELPPIVHTDYSVRVDRSLTSGFSPGGTIVVSLLGGSTPDAEFVYEAGPRLQVGNEYLFFLNSFTDGKYYPLAGGAAIGAKQSDSSYTISSEASGDQDLIVTARDLVDPLTISVKQAKIDFRKKPDNDRARFKGTFTLATGASFSCGDDVSIALNGSVVAVSLAGSKFALHDSQCGFKLGSDARGPIDSFKLDLNLQTFDLKLRDDLDLSGLSNPVELFVRMNDSEGSQSLTMREHGDDWDYKG